MAELELQPDGKTETIYKIFQKVAAGAVIAGSLGAPNLLLLLARLVDKDQSDKTLRSLRYAKSRGWLLMRDTPTGVEIALSKRGKMKWRQMELSHPLSDMRWDGKWRLVMFDIPAKKKAASDVFRLSLKRLGMIQLQRSVWVTPYHCETQIAALRQIYEIQPYVHMAEVSSIEREADLKLRFQIDAH